MAYDLLIASKTTIKCHVLDSLAAVSWQPTCIVRPGEAYSAPLDLLGRGGLVVTRLPAAREDRGSRRAAGKSLCFHENHCDTQLWARAAH